MKWLIPLCILIEVFFNSNAYCKCTDKPVVIAVVDTGFGFQGYGMEARLCKMGHKDFTTEKQYIPSFPGVIDPVPLDNHRHGTNITGIIENYLKQAHINYCIVVLKYHSPLQTGWANLYSTIDAFKYATKIKADYINYSSGGKEPSNKERIVVEQYLNEGGKLIVAAGNEAQDLDVDSLGYYPAKYDKRITVVGMLMPDGRKAPLSNYGKVVNRWEVGYNVSGYSIVSSGTSQATAVATGKIVSQSQNKCDKVR